MVNRFGVIIKSGDRGITFQDSEKPVKTTSSRRYSTSWNKEFRRIPMAVSDFIDGAYRKGYIADAELLSSVEDSLADLYF